MTNPIDMTITTPGALTLDECLRRAPSTLGKIDIKHMVEILRADRVRFADKAEKRKAKAEGIEDEEAEAPSEGQD